MSVELWILVATAVLAVVAISAAIVAVRAARRLAAPAATHAAGAPGAPAHDVPSTPGTPAPSFDLVVHEPVAPRPAPTSRIVEGRLVTAPTEHQVLATAMGRPGVRLSILAHGVAHALRAESRDRISAMMRREYRRRRRERLQAGRRAIRAAQPTPPSDQWLGS